jgi:3-oxoacyl-[acyl-carrier-protein] synthase II
MGMISPVGHTVDETWERIVAGKSGAAPITSFDVSNFSTQFSASVRDFDISPYLSPKEARKLDVFVQYGMAAGIQAMLDSGLEVTEENAPRIGCSIGSGIGGIGQIEKKRGHYC